MLFSFSCRLCWLDRTEKQKGRITTSSTSTRFTKVFLRIRDTSGRRTSSGDPLVPFVARGFRRPVALAEGGKLMPTSNWTRHAGSEPPAKNKDRNELHR